MSLVRAVYRDFWLLCITGLVVWALVGVQGNVSQIQHSRERAIREGCEQQNLRNHAAYGFLSGLPVTDNAPKLTPVERDRLIQKFTDALVGPVQNCEKRVQQVTR